MVEAKILGRGRKRPWEIIQWTLLLTLILFPSPLSAQQDISTILTAERTNESITIDGVSNETSWSRATILSIPVFDGKIGNIEVAMKALYDEEYLYLYLTWPDETKSDRLLWRYNGSAWVPPENTDQDIMTLFFNINESVWGFDIAGCAITCHADRMHTNGPEEFVDNWKWHAAYDNAAGYMMDGYMDDTLVIGETIKPGYSSSEMNKTWQAFKLDETEPGYVEERKNTKHDIDGRYIGPLFYEPDSTIEDQTYLTLEEIEKGEAVEFLFLDKLNDERKIPDRFTVPAYIQERPRESSGDISAQGLHRDGYWQLEVARKLATGNRDDVQFDTTKTYRFSISVHDDSRGSANTGIGHGHSISLVARTLEFGGRGSAEVVQLALIRDYLVSSRAYVNRGENGLALSTVSDALTIFNRIRDPIANIDPELFIKMRNGFVASRRNPSLENINQLTEDVDLAILTFQGKREPSKATPWLRILVLWGRFQIYAFIALAVLVIIPIARMLKIMKRSEFRYLSIFMLMLISPIFLEGAGRLGAFLHIPLLENFSFTTSEFVTLMWAIGMFLALYVGRIGFNEIEHTLKSLEYQSKELKKRMLELRKSQEQLLKSERLASIGQLAASMAHELRNPLGVIRNSIYYLKMALTKKEPKIKKHLSLMEEELVISNKIITDLLDFSRGKEPVLRDSDINKIVEKAVAKSLVPDKVEIELKLSKDIPTLRLDKDQILLVFTNMIINGIQSMSKGGKIEISTKKERRNVIIEFMDNGIGISKEDLDKIFEPLFTTKAKGIGLGLPLSKRIIEMHGGKIEVSSKAKEGSKFTIKIPITKKEV